MLSFLMAWVTAPRSGRFKGGTGGNRNPPGLLGTFGHKSTTP